MNPIDTVVERFRAAIVRRMGLEVEDTRGGLLDEVLDRRVRATGDDVDHYLAALEDGAASRDEIRALALELTVGETYFFRNVEQYDALREAVLPALVAARSHERRLRVLSAGCSSGEEPYSLAILLREHVDPTWTLEIHGIDINRNSIARATTAVYSPWSLRATPPAIATRWLPKVGREHVLDPQIKAMVQFAERNLAGDDNPLRRHTYDVVFCRNVIMYFSLEQQRRVVERLGDALVPGGHLFLGHAESLRGLSHDFHLQHTHGTFYYRRRAPDEAGDALPMDPVAAAAPPVVTTSVSWVDAIHEAASRVRSLSDDAQAVGARAAPPRSRAPELAVAIDLLRRECYAEALAVLDALPGDDDDETLLLRAVLHTHAGRVHEAELACRAVLARDELCAGAHYLLGLCAERSGDIGRAAEHDQVASYLDAGFAMPRLHLGLMARRRGDREAARRELGQSLVLLEREEASRLMLYGGGFGRDALIALCRAEIIACGGRP